MAVGDNDGRYRVGYGIAAVADQVQAAQARYDPAHIARKGDLMLLADESVPAEVIEALCVSYYEDNSYDVLEPLAHKLAVRYRRQPDLVEALPGLLVRRGNDLYIVATDAVRMTALRGGETRILFGRQGYAGTLWAQPLARATAAHGWRLYGTRAQLWRGDLLVATLAATWEAVSPRRLRLEMRLRRGTKSLAKALAERAGRQMDRDTLPLILIRVAVHTPTPEIGPMGKAPEAVSAPRMRRDGVSPVWITLLLAVVMVAGVYALRGPSLSRGASKELLMHIFLPEALQKELLEEGDDATEESSEVYLYDSAPQLVYPADSETVFGVELPLSWRWPQDLAEDERFQVDVWRAGDAPHHLALTDNTQVRARYESTGWHAWSVTVVRIEEDEVVEQLSPTSRTARFYWWESQRQ